MSADEFNEFINERDLPLEKLTETGRRPELVMPSLRDQEIALREEHLKELLALNNTDSEDNFEEDVTNELKVFRDPTFNDFIQIVGTQYDPDLPLFAQLYICKEMLQFYQVNQNRSFLGLCVFNILANAGYFLFTRRLLYKKQVALFSIPRVVLFFLGSHIIHENLILKHVQMNKYRVNINDLLDLDEDFLFENPAFCELVRRVKDEHEYLVNPIFDVSGVTANSKATRDKDPTRGMEVRMNQGELIPLFQ